VGFADISTYVHILVDKKACSNGATRLIRWFS